MQAHTVWSTRAAQDCRAAGGLNRIDYGRRGRGASCGDKLGGKGERRGLDACRKLICVSEGTPEQEIGSRGQDGFERAGGGGGEKETGKFTREARERGCDVIDAGIAAQRDGEGGLIGGEHLLNN